MAWSFMLPIILKRSFWVASGGRTPSGFMEGHTNSSIFQPTISIRRSAGLRFLRCHGSKTIPIRFKSYFLKGYSLVISLTLPITIFCALFADDIILVILGPKWTEAAVIFRLLTPTVLIFGMINPFGWLLLSIGLQGRSLAIALVIAPLVITAYVIGLPYGPSGVAFAYSAAMTLWLVPHVAWCLHGTMISPWDLFLAVSRPFLSGIVAAAFAFGVQFYFGQLESPVLEACYWGRRYA